MARRSSRHDGLPSGELGAVRRSARRVACSVQPLARCRVAARRTATRRPSPRRKRLPIRSHAGSLPSASASDGPGDPSRRSIASVSGRPAPGRASTPIRSITTRPGSATPSCATASAGQSLVGDSRRTSCSERHRGRRSRIARQPSATAGVTVPSPGVGALERCSPRAQQGRLVEQRVLVEVRERREPLRGRPVAEHRHDRRREHLGEVEVDGPHRPVQVHVLVHEQAGREEHLERADARFVERQPALRHERVAAQPLGVHRAHRDARQVRVAPDVVEVVDREHARQQRLQDPDPGGHRRVGERRLRDQERDPAGVDRLVRPRTGRVREPRPARDAGRG